MKTIILWLKWILYFIMTQNERMMYDYGKAKGRKCIRIKKRIFSTTFYSKHGEQERDYLTRKEYFAINKHQP